MASQEDVTMAQTDLAIDETMRTDIHDAELEESGHDENAVTAPNGTLQVTETPIGSQAKVKEVPVFATMLMSPIITLVVGADDTHEFAVHRDLLTQCKHFSQLFESSNFVGDATPPTSITITEHNRDTIGSFLEYLYTGEYTPRRLPNSDKLEDDTGLDADGEQLIRHARIFVLAIQYGLPYLARLARYKIGCVDASTLAEIMYARFVYATECEDLKGPVVQHWASVDAEEVHAVEAEFKALGNDYPCFYWDILCKRNFTPPNNKRAVEAPAPSTTPPKSRKRGRKPNAVAK